jgi:hypothetical protein
MERWLKADAKAAKSGAACRYVDNGDGTVSDLDTGLMWEQKRIPGVGFEHDVDATFTSCAGSGDSCTNPDNLADGTAFTVFLAALNNGVFRTFPGPQRPTSPAASRITVIGVLPSHLELQGILDPSAPGCGSGDPCIDPVFGPTQADCYWSATSLSTGDALSIYAWDVGFGNTFVDFPVKPTDHYVRAVRGGL